MVRIKSLHLGISLKAIGGNIKNAFWRFGTWCNRLHVRRNRLHLSSRHNVGQKHCVMDYTYGVIDYTSTRCVKISFSSFSSVNFHWTWTRTWRWRWRMMLRRMWVMMMISSSRSSSVGRGVCRSLSQSLLITIPMAHTTPPC